eukprot:2128652-Rhodomonas_salina.2
MLTRRQLSDRDAHTDRGHCVCDSILAPPGNSRVLYRFVASKIRKRLAALLPTDRRALSALAVFPNSWNTLAVCHRGPERAAALGPRQA